MQGDGKDRRYLTLYLTKAIYSHLSMPVILQIYAIVFEITSNAGLPCA
jgi:hypothetical protein